MEFRCIIRTVAHQVVPLLFTTPGHGFQLFVVGEPKTGSSPSSLSPSLKRSSILASRWVRYRGIAFVSRVIHHEEILNNFFTTSGFLSRSHSKDSEEAVEGVHSADCRVSPLHHGSCSRPRQKVGKKVLGVFRRNQNVHPNLPTKIGPKTINFKLVQKACHPE